MGLELKDKMYIRTKVTDNCNMVCIRKIDLSEFNDDQIIWIDEDVANSFGDLLCHIEESDIEIASCNPIDLLKDGDLVTLEYYVRKYGKRISRRFLVSIVDNYINFENYHCSYHYRTDQGRFTDGKGYNPVIISIITDEQLRAGEYSI